ncbi:hypothetical protein [Deferrisoma palaeochoriense]
MSEEPTAGLPWERAALAWVESLERGRPTPAGGSLAWVTLAGAAGLAAKLEAIEGRCGEGCRARARAFVRAAADDAEGFRRARTPGERTAFLRRSGILVEEANRFLEELQAAAARCDRAAIRPDWEAALRLAGAALEVLWENQRVNAATWGAGAGSGPKPGK